jgi:hypothetical protein
MRAVPLGRMLSMLALIFSVMIASPMSTMARPGDNSGPGNSGGAKMCQAEGWMGLARYHQPTVGFTNENECVSYGAQGGTLVPLQYGIFIPAGVAVTFSGVLSGCNALAGNWSSDNGDGGPLGSFGPTFGAGCGTTHLISESVGPFDQDVQLTFALTDNSCSRTYISTSDHANVAATGTGYQVDITDAGWTCPFADSARVPAPGGGNLSVAIDFSW